MDGGTGIRGSAESSTLLQVIRNPRADLVECTKMVLPRLDHCQLYVVQSQQIHFLIMYFPLISVSRKLPHRNLLELLTIDRLQPCSACGSMGGQYPI